MREREIEDQTAWDNTETKKEWQDFWDIIALHGHFWRVYSTNTINTYVFAHMECQGRERGSWRVLATACIYCVCNQDASAGWVTCAKYIRVQLCMVRFLVYFLLHLFPVRPGKGVQWSRRFRSINKLTFKDSSLPTLHYWLLPLYG